MAAPRAEIPLVILAEASPTSPVAGATVFVKNRLTETLINVYANAGTTEEVITQPLSSDLLGRITGWLPRGSYKVEITVPGKSAYSEFLDIAPGQDGSVDTAFIANEAVTLEKIASSAKNAAAGTSSLRSLGTSSITAAAGNDSRLSDTRTPTDGSVTTAKLANEVVTNAKMAAGSGFIPTGGLIPWAGTTAPIGFLLADGASKVKASFEPLFNVCEYKYGGSGANFNLPDLRGRVIIMVDGGAARITANNTLAAVSGLQEIGLSAGQLPGHSHNFGGNTTTESAIHTHNANLGREGTGGNWMLKSGDGGGGMSGQTAFHVHGYSGTTDGGNGLAGSAHYNVQPYLVLNYIIKT